jgi:hypothetical protein
MVSLLFIGAQLLHAIIMTIGYGIELFSYPPDLLPDSLEGLLCSLICLAVMFVVCLRVKYALPWVWGICMLAALNILCYTGWQQWTSHLHLEDLLYGVIHGVQLALVIPALFVLISRRRAFRINMLILIGLLIAGATLIVFVYLRSEYLPFGGVTDWAVEPPFYYKRLDASGFNYPQEKSLALLLLSFIAYYSVYKLAVRWKREEESTNQ